MMNKAAPTAIATTGVLCSCSKGYTVAYNCRRYGLPCSFVCAGTVCSNTPPVEIEEIKDDDLVEKDETNQK